MNNEDYTGLFFTVDCILAALNAGFAVWYATRGDPFCIISFVACGISVYAAVDMLRYRKKRKHLMEEHERVMQRFAALSAYYEQMRDEQMGDEQMGEIAYSNYIKKREELPKASKKLIHLALHHKKARVRKKNANRIIREEKE